MKQSAHIENWTYTTWFGGVLIGEISAHPNQTSFLGEKQMTSKVIHFDPENNRAETLNTIYTLGVPAAKPFKPALES